MIEEGFALPETLNSETQPADRHALFNNWARLPEAWYFTIRSADLAKGGVASFRILDQKLVLFRDEEGRAHALDSYCPHMGTDLSQGKVVGGQLRCPFHHWQFDSHGRCRKIPALDKPMPAQGMDMGLRGYPVQEKYGLIWVYAGETPRVPVLDVPDLEGREVVVSLGKLNRNRSHHHISMINGLDAQHLKTVHNLNIEMDVDINQSSERMDIVLSGDLSGPSPVDRTMRFLFGPRYSYAMTYVQSSVAALTLLRNVYFQKPTRMWPRLHMLYAYRPLKPGWSETQPIYVTYHRPGPFGLWKSKLILWMTKRAYFFLKDEDDKIYDHIRFDARRLLAIDGAVKQYIEFVNRLKPSAWTLTGTTPIKEDACLDHPAVTAPTADSRTISSARSNS